MQTRAMRSITASSAGYSEASRSIELETYASLSRDLYLPDFYPRANGMLNAAFPGGSPGLARRGMGLAQQDAVIALHLMVEDCQHGHSSLFDGEDSRWGHYLDVLPRHVILRLNTFGDEEYAAMRDENLERTDRD